MVLTLTGDVDAVVGGEEEVASDTPFETGSSFSSLSWSIEPPFFRFNLANREDSRSGKGGISSKTKKQEEINKLNQL